ncbi:MAG: hypothetical protein U5K28_12565 [Halobacteriales archaeon]|nr:hypothetical protein [Halobacteriales archaeon]
MRAALLLVALVLVAGCTGGGPATTATEVPTATETATETASPTPTPDPIPGTATPKTISYADLSETEQAAVRVAVNRTVRFLPDSPHVPETRFGPDVVGAFHDAESIRYDGTLYEISLTQGELYASYGVEAEPAEPGPDTTVVNATSLTDAERAVVRAAVNGGYSTELGADRPPLPDAQYVRYEGTTYQLGLIIGDYWTWKLRLSPVA